MMRMRGWMYGGTFTTNTLKMRKRGCLILESTPFNLEYLLRHPYARTIPRILYAVESLVAEKALVEPLADVPWSNFIPNQSVSTDENDFDGEYVDRFRGLLTSGDDPGTGGDDWG